MASPAQAAATLTGLTDELEDRAKEWAAFDAYYRGEQALHYASNEFRNYFANRFEGFADNWTQVVADAPTERLEVVGIRPRGGRRKSGDSDLWRLWRENEADYYSDLAFLDAIIGRRAFALVWADPDTQEPTITWENPSQAIVGYDPETRRRTAGAKVWRDDATEYATLYLPDGVYKFQRPVVTTSGRTQTGLVVPGAVGGWRARQPDGEPWPLDNPLGEVPLVELSNRARLLGDPISDVQGTVAMQDAINLLWAYTFNAADFASFPQRVVLNAERPVTPVLDDQGQVVGERPVPLERFAVDRAVWIEDKDAKIAEWSPAKLDAYTDIVEVAVGHLAAQTRTPQHYLIGKIANLSAEALKAAETGLVARTREKTEHFGRGVREVFRLLARIRGNERKARAVKAGEVLWRDIESRSEAQLADSLLKLAELGFPFEFLAERYGLSPTEIERVRQMRRDETDRILAGDLSALTGPKPQLPQAPAEEA